MENWLRERLSVCLDFEIPDDMIKYVMSIKSSNEFDEYFETLLNKECEGHRLFLADCKQRLFSKSLPSKKMSNSGPQSKKQISAPVTGIKQSQTVVKKNEPQNNSQLAASKKKTKFVSLYASDGKMLTDTILLKGRRTCDCQASEHKLINNCLSCGRIVCEQEGSGPCLFCGELVCTNDEMQIIKSSSKKGENLMKSLKEKGGRESLRNAIEQRDRLLEYDRNSEKRTTVIDDELDYFQENSVWLSNDEREKYELLKKEIHDKKHGSRMQRKITVDFAGREVNEDDIISKECENTLKQIRNFSANPNVESHDYGFSDPNNDIIRPIYIPVNDENKQVTQNHPFNDCLERNYNRVQDKELLEMQDLRQCLSLHQPYASLLVAGIKKHEGRVWYSEHRGRLWIAATSKQAHSEEIKEVESFYRDFYNDPKLTLPNTYPTGCLLGCVNVEECLPQEEYRELYPKSECDSPYVFICSKPEQLPVNLPIKGEHKIYKINPKIHTTALKFLMRLKTAKE